MTCEKVISEVNSLLPNTFDEVQKYRWLSDAERFAREVLSGYESFEHLGEPMENLLPDTDSTRELSAPAPYAEMYIYYVLAEINLLYGDLTKYNSYSTLYENMMEKFKKHCIRSYKSNMAVRRFKVV